MADKQQQDETDKNIEMWKVKRLIKGLEVARGNGTSMVGCSGACARPWGGQRPPSVRTRRPLPAPAAEQGICQLFVAGMGFPTSPSLALAATRSP
jgi:peptide subunit release factor 1 (eRF1)